MKEELKSFGLTENEARVYLALIEMREASTITPLRNKVDLHTSRVYEALNSLVEKGLVSYFIKNNRKHFQAQDPTIMYDILDEKKAKLYKIMPQIRALKPRYTQTNKVSLHEGYKALKQLYDHLLFEMKKGEERLVLGAQPETAHFLGKTYFKEYTLRRIKKKIKMRMIFNADAKKTAKEYAKMSYTKVRMLPKGINSPAATDIYPDKVSVLLLKEKPQIFHIECKEVAQSYKDYFELLWEMSKEVKR